MSCIDEPPLCLSEFPLKPLKRRRSLITWAFLRGSSPQLASSTGTASQGCLFGRPLGAVCVENALPKAVMVGVHNRVEVKRGTASLLFCVNVCSWQNQRFIFMHEYDTFPLNEPRFSNRSLGKFPASLLPWSFWTFTRRIPPLCNRSSHGFCHYTSSRPLSPRQDMLALLYHEGPWTRGIFRRPAGARAVRELRDSLDAGEFLPPLTRDHIFIVAGVFKVGGHDDPHLSPGL